MTAFAELLKAIAALLWPGVALLVIGLYHREIRLLLSRIRKGKILGQEVELSGDLDALNVAATAAEAEVRALPPAPAVPSESAVATAAPDAIAERVLTVASSSPKAALLLLAAELERTLTQLLASLGVLGGRDFVAFAEGIAMLSRGGQIPPSLRSSVDLFYRLRNRLVHGKSADDDDIMRAIDSGLSILRALEGIPHERHYVYHPGVPIYSDPQCTQVIEGARAVILETQGPDTGARLLHAFPSTLTHFQKGRRVAWEWSRAHRFNEAWYRDPDTNAIAHAWSESSEFVGRHLDDI